LGLGRIELLIERRRLQLNQGERAIETREGRVEIDGLLKKILSDIAACRPWAA
jgi:hypothetical protein